MRAMCAALLIPVIVIVSGCSDDGTSPRFSSFAQFQQVFADDCASCHGPLSAHANLNNTFQVTMDSAALIASGFINPSEPSRSLLIQKALNITPHGGGRIVTFTPEDEGSVIAWIRKQPDPYAYQLFAGRIAPSSAPLVDGNPSDPSWTGAARITVPINGGWADAGEITIGAVYDGEYAYFLLQWKDDGASDRRQPWIKQSDGTWRVGAAKPFPYDGWSWPTPGNSELPQYMYEDKVALMWNTYGVSTVAGFDQGGCAVTCHDPAREFGPGKTYFYSDENRAAKKYTNAPGEIADIWHWKFVRMNQHFKLDDQFVKDWQPYTGDPHNGGRSSDEGKGGYGDNPATNGIPTYRGRTAMTAPPFYILDNEKQAVTAAELASLPAGAMIPNMITSGPTGYRADVDARGNYDAAQSLWTLEIRRKMITGDTKDVQFDNLAREYAFGVAVFDNAQIEHSYSSTPLRLRFQP